MGQGRAGRQGQGTAKAAKVGQGKAGHGSYFHYKTYFKN